MLNDFYESCYRFDLEGNWFLHVGKNKEDYRYTRIKENVTHRFSKSYSKGLESEHWDYKNGDSRSIRYSSDVINF